MTHVISEFVNGVGRITLNRPDKRNALTRQIIEDMLQAVTAMSANDELRVLLFDATGKVFCAGMDLGEMQERATSANSAEEWNQDSRVYADLLVAIFQLKVPTVATIQGPVLAGGMGFVLACDILIVAESAFFSLPEPMRGITAAMVTPLLVHRIGAGQAGYMLLAGERVSAQKALQIGLAHDVVVDDELQTRTSSLVQAIMTGSQAALAITKKHITDCVTMDVEQEIRKSIEVSAMARSTDDAREGLAAFLEKRKPSWQG